MDQTEQINTLQAAPEVESEGAVEGATYFVWRYVQCCVDRVAIYPFTRWLFAVLLLVFYVYRAVLNQGKKHCKRKSRLPYYFVFFGFVCAGQVLGIYFAKGRRGRDVEWTRVAHKTERRVQTIPKGSQRAGTMVLLANNL